MFESNTETVVKLEEIVVKMEKIEIWRNSCENRGRCKFVKWIFLVLSVLLPTMTARINCPQLRESTIRQ